MFRSAPDLAPPFTPLHIAVGGTRHLDPTIRGMTVVDRPTISGQFLGRFHAHGLLNKRRMPSIYRHFGPGPRGDSPRGYKTALQTLQKITSAEVACVGAQTELQEPVALMQREKHKWSQP